MKYNTGKRKQIIDFLSENAHSSFSLEEISERVAPDGKGKSTVYRIVSELLDAKVVKRISDGKTRHCSYQYIGSCECQSHLHLKCRDCGKLIHLNKDISESFATELRKSGGFKLEEGCMLFGQCANCEEYGQTSERHSSPPKEGLV